MNRSARDIASVPGRAAGGSVFFANRKAALKRSIKDGRVEPEAAFSGAGSASDKSAGAVAFLTGGLVFSEPTGTAVTPLSVSASA